MKDFLQKTKVILVEPSHPDNVGSVARLCKNFEIGSLTIVSDKDPREEKHIWKLARPRSFDMLEKLSLAPNLSQALQGTELVIGFSKPYEFGRKNVHTLPTLLPLLNEHLKVAFVFGRESSGLTNQELELCHLICEIPSSPAMHSINLSHAVGMVLARVYELFMDSQRTDLRLIKASYEDLERLFEHLEESLILLGFDKAGNPRRMMVRLKKLFSRSDLSKQDTSILRGILSRIQRRVQR